MRYELTRVGLLVELANPYTTRGAFEVGDYVQLVFLVIYVSVVSAC